MAGTLVANTINTDTGLFSTNNAYTGICKAWVNFNGLSGASPVIRASFNVSSVTRNSTGNYTLAFTSALSDANYAPVFGGSAAFGTSASGNAWFAGVYTSSAGGSPALKSTTQLQVGAANGGLTITDAPDIYVAILGN